MKRSLISEFLNTVLGIFAEVSATVIMMAVIFFIGLLILGWFGK